MEVVQIEDGLKTGEFELIPSDQKGKRKQSVIYEKNVFQRIANKGKVLDGVIACSICLRVFANDNKNGTANFIRHMNNCLEDTKKVSTEEISNSDCVKLKGGIIKDVVQFVAQDMRPYASVSGAGFVNLAETLIQAGARYGNVSAKDILPNPSTVSKHTHIIAEEKRNELSIYFEKKSLQGVAITTDIWTDNHKKQSYLGVNVHYIDAGRIQERTLAVEQIESEQSAAVIFDKMQNILGRFRIDHKNVILVTDRGSNLDLLLHFHYSY